MNSLITSYVISLRESNPVTPIVIDENGALSLLSLYFGEPIEIFENLRTGDFSGLFIYDVPPDKQHLDILTIRKCIADMSLEPYSGRSLAVLRNFHTATVDAQNALLKLLEDCPQYAAIILIVADVEALIDTIRSRVISFYICSNRLELDSSLREQVDDFFSDRSSTFISYLHDAKYTKEEAISLLHYATLHGDAASMGVYQAAIEALFSTNENPRNILDVTFLH